MIAGYCAAFEVTQAQHHCSQQPLGRKQAHISGTGGTWQKVHGKEREQGVNDTVSRCVTGTLTKFSGLDGSQTLFGTA
jgi:hypothetical protein